MTIVKQVAVWVLVLHLSGLGSLLAQPILIQPNDPFGGRAPVGMGAENLRVSRQNPDGTEALLTIDYTYDGFAGPVALVVPVIGKRGEKGVGAWFGSDPVTVGRGRGTISLKVRYFNDEPGVPPMFTSDQVQILILNQSGTVRLFAVPFLKTIKWGSATAKPAVAPPPAVFSVVETEAAKKLAEEKRKAEEQARAEAEVREKAKLQAEAEAKARLDAEKRARAEALARDESRRKAEAEAARIAAEAKLAEEKRLADEKSREQERQRAEAEQKRLAEEKRIAEEKARAEALARDEARKKAEAETRRLAEAKAREEQRLKAEAEAKRLAEERRVAEEKAKAEALAREAAQKKAEEEARRLAEERRIAEEKARAEGLARAEAQRQAEAEAKRLAEEKRIAEEKALAEAKARQAAEEKAREAALAQARAEAEAKRLAEEKRQAEALAQAAETSGTRSPAASFDLAQGMKTRITNVDVVNRSIDRTQMTFGVEFEYRDRISNPLIGLDVFRQAQPEVSRYFVSGSAEIGKSRRNFALLPVKFQPPAGLADSAAFSTDKVIVYLQEAASGRRFNLFPATMLLVWRAAGTQVASGQSTGNSVEIDDFKQNDPSNGYVSVKYHLLAGRGRLLARIYDARRPESALYFSSEVRDVQAGRGLQLVDVRVAEDSKSPTEIISADTVEVELVDSEGKVLASVSRRTSMVWSKPK